jgi:hypothetical protein
MLSILTCAFLAVEDLLSVCAGLLLADKPYLFAAAAAHREVFLETNDSVEV